jgi:hypothetical protein
MILPPLSDLRLWGAFHRGVPNEERVTLQNVSGKSIQLGAYCVVVGLRRGGLATPMKDEFFWFGDIVVPPKGWVFLYTGSGETRTATTQGTGEPAVVFYWGKKTTIFHNPVLTPIAFRFGEVAVDTTSGQDLLSLEHKKP